MNPLNIHRVEHPTISRRQFEVEPKTYKSKTLRWYKNNHPRDSWLRVEDPHPDGSFVLYCLGAWVQHPKTEQETGHAHLSQESLDQAIVDKIEVAPKSAHLHDCDFVIFENAPLARESCQAKDQSGSQAAS